MTPEESRKTKICMSFVLGTILVFSSAIVPMFSADSFAQEQLVIGADSDLGIRPVFAGSDTEALSSDPSSNQPWVAAYHDPVPDHFAAYKTKVTCNFGGTDRTKIQLDNFIACAQSLQSPTSVTGLDYGVQASVTLKTTGDMIVSADVWRACESQPGVGCSPGGSITKVSSNTATISAALSDDITLYLEWGSTGSTLTWYYQINSGTPTQYHTWTKPSSEAHPRFNTGICFISWSDCAESFIIRTARYFQAGIGSAYAIEQAGWFVTIKNPAFATSTTASYSSFFSPARVIHGDDAFFDNDFKWGGLQYTGVNADYNLAIPSVPKGQVKFYYTGTTITNNIQLWSGLPKTVATSTYQLSPTTSESYEGEQRIIDLQGTTQPSSVNAPARYMFYYDGSNLVYKKSNNGGETWGNAVSLGTGTLVSDSYRWSLVQTTYSGTQYVIIFYWVQGNPDTQNHHFKLIRGTANSGGTDITWSSPIELGYTLAHADCGTGGACAAVVTATDSNGVMYAAFRYKPGGQNNYYFSIKYSNDGGANWFDSWSHSDIGSTYPPTMALTKLASGKMLFTYAFYNSDRLNYKVFTPGSGWTSSWTTVNGWPTAANKQISADSLSGGTAYVAYVSGGTSGILKVIQFNKDTGNPQLGETADSTISTHSLPSIDVEADGDIYIYTVANSKIYSTEKEGITWLAPTNPFGTTFTSPNQLTTGRFDNSLIWKEGSSDIRNPHGY